MPSVARRFAALAVVACVAMGVLSGCVGSTPKPTPTPKPTATPLYSSDAKALAAAKESYAKYVAVSNQVAHDGWADLAPLKTVATGDVLRGDTKAGQKNRAGGLHIEGDIRGDVRTVQRVSSSTVSAYACLDVSQTRVLDENGQDKTSTNRTDVIPLEISFESHGGALLVARSDPWSGQSYCS